LNGSALATASVMVARSPSVNCRFSLVAWSAIAFAGASAATIRAMISSRVMVPFPLSGD